MNGTLQDGVRAVHQGDCHWQLTKEAGKHVHMWESGWVRRMLPSTREQLLGACDYWVFFDQARARPRIMAAHPRAPRPASRFTIMKRDNYRCRLCGVAARDGEHVRLEVDHITPRSKGGKNDASNLWTLCFPCNRGKGVNEL